MKKQLSLVKILILNLIFFGCILGVEKKTIYSEVKSLVITDIKSSLRYALRYSNHELIINKDVFIYQIKEIVPLSLKQYNFKQTSLKIGYIYEEGNIKGVQVCLSYQKNIISGSIKLQYMLPYLM